MKNLPLLSGIYATYGANLLIPIYVPYVMARGLSLGDVFLLQSIFAATLFVAEIPTGHLSDRWGRVRTTILGSGLRFFGILLYFTGGGFWSFACAEIVSGLGISCHSGTLDALTYETLTEEKQESTYRRVNGRQRFYFFGAEAVGSLAAGFLAIVHLRAPVAVVLVLSAIGLLLSLLLLEPTRHQTMQEYTAKDLWHTCRNTVIHDPRLRGIIVLFSILATMGLAFFWFTQPYQGMIALPLALYGVAHAIIVLAGAIASRFAHTLDTWLSDQLTLLLIACLIIGSAVALGFLSSVWGLGLFLLIRVGWTLVVPVTNDICNRATDNRHRATVLSVKAFGQRLLFLLTFPVFSILSERVSINQAILLTAVVGGCAVAVAFWTMRGVWSAIPEPDGDAP